MKRQNSVVEVLVSQSRFRLFPQQLVLASAIQDGTRYTIYMQKGKQVLGQINKKISTENVFDSKIVFQAVQNSFNFQIFHQRNMKCQWSLYAIKDQTQYFVESVQFDLKDTWGIYAKDRTKNYLKDQIKFRKSGMVIKFGLLIAPDQDFLNKFMIQMQAKQKKRTIEGKKSVSNLSQSSQASQPKISEAIQNSKGMQPIVQETKQSPAQPEIVFQQEKVSQSVLPIQRPAQIRTEEQVHESNIDSKLNVQNEFIAQIDEDSHTIEVSNSENKGVQQEGNINANEPQEAQKEEEPNIVLEQQVNDTHVQSPIKHAQQAASFEISEVHEQQLFEEKIQEQQQQAPNNQQFQLTQTHLKQPLVAQEQNENKEGLDNAVNQVLSNVLQKEGVHIEKIHHKKVEQEVKLTKPQQVVAQKPRSKKMKYLMIAVAFIIIMGVAMFGFSTPKAAKKKRTKKDKIPE